MVDNFLHYSLLLSQKGKRKKKEEETDSKNKEYKKQTNK